MLNLNDPMQFTPAGVKDLIASKDDSEDRQLRVTKEGIAYLSDSVGADDIDDILFRFETWDEKNNYIGVKASNDTEWVSRIYEALRKNFPTPTKRYIDDY
jgi:hypothetical protein